MRPLVIYHDSCTDGFGAAFAAWLVLGDEAEYVPCQYGQEDKWPIDVRYSHLLRERDVYILDFSFPRELMDFIFKHAQKVTWLDHHASSRVMAEEL